MIATQVSVDKRYQPSTTISGELNQEFGIAVILPSLQNRIYYFRPERMNVGRCQFGHNRILAPNATNLPEVLNILQNDPIRYARYLDKVRDVLPQIRYVSAPPSSVNASDLEIHIWSHDPASERADLAQPLLECG